MALIKCYECAKDISDKAPACPQCGAPRGEIVEEYWDSGELKLKKTFQWGKQNGIEESYYEDGQLLNESTENAEP